MQVIWSKAAQKSYLNTLKSILDRWTLKEGEAFETKVFSFVKTLSTNNRLCPPSKIVNYRRCVISKQTSLVYEISGNTIMLVAFVDNKSQHKY